MEKQSILSKALFLRVGVILLFSGIIGQTLSSTQEDVKKESEISWEDTNIGVTEYQSIEFTDEFMVVTRKSVFKNGSQVQQVANIPLNKVDISRMESHPGSEVEGMFYLDIFTKENEKSINVTTDYGKDKKGKQKQKGIEQVYFYTLYSLTEQQNLELKEKIEKLVHMMGG